MPEPDASGGDIYTRKKGGGLGRDIVGAVMPALKKTELVGVLDWIGYVPDRAASLLSVPLPAADLIYGGIAGEAHGGLTRPSCSRVISQHQRGTDIANVRQLCVMSREELDLIAADCGMAALDPRYAGASLVIAGIPDLTHLPPSSRLQFASGATIVVDMENRPCHLPAKGLNADHPGKGDAFKQAAKGRRGVTAWVERQGAISLGDRVVLHVPDQRRWRGAR